VTDLFVAAVSIAPTRRRRFLWAAWWTAPPSRDPFRRPDAAEGGARTREEALRQAEQAAGRALVEVEGLWARAWARVLMGQPPFPTAGPTSASSSSSSGARRARAEPEPGSIWQILGVAADASVAQIRAAFRQRALVTHPDHGGDAEAFRALGRARDEALARRARNARRPTARR